MYSQCQYFKWGKQSSTCEANEPGSFVAELPRAIKQGGVNAGTVDYAQTFSWIKTAIYNRNPPILRYSWKSSSLKKAHALPVRGFNTGESGTLRKVKYVFIQNAGGTVDSFYKTSPYSWLQNNEDATWTHTLGVSDF